MKKAYEVVVAVTGGSKDQERIIFVAANSKREVVHAHDVERVFTRSEMKAEDCPYELVDNAIISK